MTTTRLRRPGTNLGRSILRDWRLYVMLILPLAFYIIFCYKPMLGVGIAFTRYNPVGGMWKSKWIGLDNFKFVMKMPDFPIALGNTLLLNFMGLIAGFPVPIILAIMLNEIRSTKVKKVSQTLLYLPHFLSWVIIGGMVLQIFAPTTGVVNATLLKWGWIDKNIPFLTEGWPWRITYTVVGVWQSMGWGTILYLSAITGINMELFEAAKIDGANKLQQIWHVTLPGIRSTFIMLTIISVGSILSAGFDQVYVFYNELVYETGDIIDTYVYRMMRMLRNYGMSAATGMYQSVLGFVFIVVVNWIARKLSDISIL